MERERERERSQSTVGGSYRDPDDGFVFISDRAAAAVCIDLLSHGRFVVALTASLLLASLSGVFAAHGPLGAKLDDSSANRKFSQNEKKTQSYDGLPFRQSGRRAQPQPNQPRGKRGDWGELVATRLPGQSSADNTTTKLEIDIPTLKVIDTQLCQTRTILI